MIDDDIDKDRDDISEVIDIFYEQEGFLSILYIN